MNITLIDKNNIEVEMEYQINEVLRTFGEDIKQDVSIPVAQYILAIKNNAEKLLKGKADIFHLVTTKLLYIMKRFRPDLELAMDFLWTRITKSDECRCNKTWWIWDQVKKKMKEKVLMGASSIHDIFMWVDVQYAVHADMQSKT